MEIERKPEPVQEEYGYKQSRDPDTIMRITLGQLAEEYCRENYTTYPIGFYKSVTLNEEDDRRIGEILEETAGIAGREAARQGIIEPKEGLAYERFVELMDEVDKILGGGSNYNKEYRERNAEVPMSYEDAVEEYSALTEKDRLTGGYARLFADYMVILLGILPVFLAVTRGLRDRRAMMQ